MFAPGANVFAIVDAGRVPMFDAETLSQGGEFACLFGGDAVETLGAFAPWLCQLTPDSKLTRRLFTDATNRRGYWAMRSAVFLRSKQDLTTLRSHLRRFTQIPDEMGKRYFLRFYCPDALPIILDTLQKDEGRLHRWFRHHHKQVIDSYWIPDNDTCEMIVHQADPTTQPAATNVPFVLDDIYRRILDEIRRIQGRRKIAHAVLLTAGNPDDLTTQEWNKIVYSSIDSAWNTGVGPERAMAYIAMAGLACRRPIAPAEIAGVLQLPATPGQQTERARHFAENAGRTSTVHNNWTVAR